MQFNDGTFWDGEDIDNLPILSINAIAHALSHICRYGGHVNSHYSVAQHSVAISYLAPPEFFLEGLLHDASEAYIGDIPAPMKHRIPEIKEFEEGIQRQIFKQYNLTWPIPQEIEELDKRICITEMQNFFDKLHPDMEKLIEEKLGSLDDTFNIKALKTAWPAEMAKFVFIEAYEYYTTRNTST